MKINLRSCRVFLWPGDRVRMTDRAASPSGIKGYARTRMGTVLRVGPEWATLQHVLVKRDGLKTPCLYHFAWWHLAKPGRGTPRTRRLVALPKHQWDLDLG